MTRPPLFLANILAADTVTSIWAGRGNLGGTSKEEEMKKKGKKKEGRKWKQGT